MSATGQWMTAGSAFSLLLNSNWINTKKENDDIKGEKREGKQINHSKQQALLYLSLATIGMILLAVSLPGLKFQAGLPIPGAETISVDSPAALTGRSANHGFLPRLVQVAMALGVILLLVALFISLLRKSNLNRIGGLTAGLVILFVLFSWLPQLPLAQPGSALSKTLDAQMPSFVYTIAPIGDPPAGLFRWVIAGLLLVVTASVGWLLIQAFRRPPKGNPLAQEAEAAVQAINSGQNLKNVIVRCYLNMESVIANEQGIERNDAMTPREFETYLVDQGIFRIPVLQLTRLFEKVRYGDQMLNQQDEQEAVSCLSAIKTACRQIERGKR